VKDMTEALVIAKEFLTPDPLDQPLIDVLRHLKAAHRKTCELELAAMDVLELLYKMRFREWKTGTGESLGLESMDEWDVPMFRLERAVNNARRKSPKRKT
jgi:hypothetical protein